MRIDDAIWAKIFSFLSSRPDTRTCSEVRCRKFVEAVFWMVRSGAQWRLLPPENGKWYTVYKRFRRWNDRGMWKDMLAHFAADPDMESVLIDSTVVRAHPCAAGAPKRDDLSKENDQALGRSRGGFSTKIHILADALGNPLQFILTGGQVADVTQARPLLETVQKAGNAIMDKGYDSDELVKYIESRNIVPVIPPRKNRKNPRAYDRHLYKERHLIECFINKIKHYRRIFSRFDKLAPVYMGFISCASTLIWLR